MIYWDWIGLDLGNNTMAQLDLDAIQQTGLPNNNIPDKPAEIISDILPFVFYGAGIALLIYLVMGGLQMMLSRGDPKAMQSAQGKITNALIGFVIIVVAFLVVQLLAQLLKSTGTGGFGQVFGTN